MYKRLKHTIYILFFLVCVPAKAFPQVDNNFLHFIDKFKIFALHNGISEETLDLAFNGITEPYPHTIKSVKKQPEFHQTAEDYLSTRLTQARINQGIEKGQELSKSLKTIEYRFGVDRRIILAIWANETNYGATLRNHSSMLDAVKALTSLAYYKSHYNKYARTQLLALLKILQNQYMSRDELKSSWAGAMGQTQFIPTSYLMYGVKLHGEGKGDIINNEDDALATAANLLYKNGWKKGQSWIYEISPRDNTKIMRLQNKSMPLKKWAGLGIHLINSKSLPYSNEIATLKKIDGENPLYLLTTSNFNVIKAYNKSDLYALSVGLLANRLQ